MSSDLADKVALVTGAGAGMGAATAELFAAHGAKVIVADINDELGEATAERIRENSGSAISVHTDVSQETSVEAAVRAAVENWGRLDVAVNNAAMSPDRAPIVDLDAELFDRILAVNLRSVALCLKHELRQMVKQGSGSIVNTASMSGVRPRRHNAAYVSSKHGVVGLTKVAALEHGDDNIRVNAVLPGGIDTPMIRSVRAELGQESTKKTDLSVFGRLGEASEVAEANLWLCSDKSSYVTGHCLAVDGGNAVL